jgi:hypothetical protein
MWSGIHHRRRLRQSARPPICAAEEIDGKTWCVPLARVHLCNRTLTYGLSLTQDWVVGRTTAVQASRHFQNEPRGCLEVEAICTNQEAEL